MNIETFKEIIKLFQTATEGAVTIGVWWLIKGFITSIVGYLLAFYGIKKFFETICKAINGYSLRNKIIDSLNKIGVKDYYYNKKGEIINKDDCDSTIIRVIKDNIKRRK